MEWLLLAVNWVTRCSSKLGSELNLERFLQTCGVASSGTISQKSALQCMIPYKWSFLKSQHATQCDLYQIDCRADFWGIVPEEATPHFWTNLSRSNWVACWLFRNYHMNVPASLTHRVARVCRWVRLPYGATRRRVWNCLPVVPPMPAVSRVSECLYRHDTSWYHATHCNTLQHTATHCNTLQHTVS